jgi:ribosomal-protein-alanine N-acetyltransferase
MNPETILYKQSTADAGEVLTHLSRCDENFFSKLCKKTDIPTYSTKIVQNSITFEAWDNDTLVALLAAYFNDKENKKGFITNVSTVKDFTGKGIASNLMNRCIIYAEENSFSEIVLEVSVENTSAVNFYKKFNFIQVSTIDDLLVMKKIIKINDEYIKGL